MFFTSIFCPPSADSAVHIFKDLIDDRHFDFDISRL